MSKAFKYYYDLMSQPSRALWIALKLCKTPYEDCPVALRKVEHLTEEYRKINRFQKVPCITDGDFHLSESVAILRYLADKGHISEALYPKGLQERARVDEFLEWQHLGLRFGCGSYFVHLWLWPAIGLTEEPSPEKVAELRKEMEKHLGIVENIWLEKSDFLVGAKLTMADLFGTCEVEQTKLCKYDVAEKFPKIGQWLERVRQETNPHYDKAHFFIYKKSGISR